MWKKVYSGGWGRGVERGRRVTVNTTFFFSPKAGSDNFNSHVKSIENALKNIDKQMGGNQTSGITQAILENLIMPPTSKKLTGHIGFVLCVRASVHPCVRASIRPFVKNRAC